MDELFRWLMTQEGWQDLSQDEAEQAYLRLSPEDRQQVKDLFKEDKDRPTPFRQRLPAQVSLPDGETTPVTWFQATDAQGAPVEDLFLPVLPLDQLHQVNLMNVLDQIYGDEWKDKAEFAGIDIGGLFIMANYMSVTENLAQQGISRDAIAANPDMDAFVSDWAFRRGRGFMEGGDEGALAQLNQIIEQASPLAKVSEGGWAAMKPEERGRALQMEMTPEERAKGRFEKPTFTQEMRLAGYEDVREYRKAKGVQVGPTPVTIISPEERYRTQKEGGDLGRQAAQAADRRRREQKAREQEWEELRKKAREATRRPERIARI